MSSDNVTSSAWYRALTLSERAAPLLRAGKSPLDAGAPFAEERARLRLERWRTVPSFDSAARFADRLALDGLEEADLHRLLGEPADAVRRRCAADPPWLLDLAAALSTHAAGDPVPDPDAIQVYAMAASLQVIAPLVRQGRARLRARIDEIVAAHAGTPFDPATIVDALYASLAPTLVTMLGRVMALELNVARIQGLLPEGTPEQRFSAFFESMASPEALAGFFAEYPVLARRLVECIGAWVDTGAEFLGRLCADWALLCATIFGGRDPGVLVQLDGSMGDTHRGGRSVRIARFASGRAVVYKPRSLAVDAHFQELLTWLDERGQEPPLRPLRLLDRGDYGWVELVPVAGCTSKDEVTRFYERQGGSLALLFVLDAADFHHENLIASGEHPVLIDLEAVFHPRFAASGRVDSLALAGAVLDDSVLRIGLLPHRMQGANGGRGMDISGLGGAAGQLTPFQVPYWEARGTDEIHLASRSVEVPVADNRPSLGGHDVDVLDFTEAVVTGFERTYRLLLANRDALRAPSGPIARFAEDEIRVIMRPTARYDELLSTSHHPDMLRDALDRDRLFDRLRIGADRLPQAARVVAAELADLTGGDIPLFTTRPGSRDLFTARGERIEAFFAEPSALQVDRRILGLSEGDLAKQVRFIRGSLATLRIGRDHVPRLSHPLLAPRVPLAPEVLRERLVIAARAIADELASTAIHAGDQVTWVGMTLLEDRYWSLAPLDIDLYTGLPGMALFFGTLGAVTGEEHYSLLAQKTLATLLARVDQIADHLTNLGAFGGWGGVLYVLSRLGALGRFPGLLSVATGYTRRIPALVPRDIGLDLVNGSAGCILALLSLHREAPSAELLETAILCGTRLIDTARPMDRGLAWQTPMPSSRPLCGLSHGATGMALALAALGTATGQARFLETARGALEYEAGLFSAEQSNWPDYRYEETPGATPGAEPVDCMTTWCHGAPGMGLARLAMLGDLDSSGIRADIAAAITTTITEGFGRSHSLCHGDAGNLELLAEASRVLGDEELATRVHGATTALLEAGEREGWRCGVLPGVEAPGLMMGLAGIGYGLLRLALPEQVPSVLTLRSGVRAGQPAGPRRDA